MIKNFVKGILFGAVAGTVGGLLLAPRSGNETRRKIIAEIDETTDLTMEVNDSLNHFKNALDNLVETAQELIPPFQKGIEKDVTAFQFQTAPRLEKINEHLEGMNAHLNQGQTVEQSSDSSLKRFTKK